MTKEKIDNFEHGEVREIIIPDVMLPSPNGGPLKIYRVTKVDSKNGELTLTEVKEVKDEKTKS